VAAPKSLCYNTSLTQKAETAITPATAAGGRHQVLPKADPSRLSTVRSSG
jgi:hypothetical protein